MTIDRSTTVVVVPHHSAERASPSRRRAMSAASAALTHLKQRRAKIEADEAEIERQVYDLETSLLTDHSSNGNVLRGFEAALSQGKQHTQKKVKPFKTEERLFSVSSESSQVFAELAAEAEQIKTTASGRLAKPPTAFGITRQ